MPPTCRRKSHKLCTNEEEMIHGDAEAEEPHLCPCSVLGEAHEADGAAGADGNQDRDRVQAHGRQHRAHLGVDGNLT